MATQKDFRIKNGLIVQNGNTTVDQGTVSIADQISGDTGQLIITNGQSGSSFMRIGIIGSGTANSHIRTDSTLEFHIGQSATSSTPSVSINTSGNIQVSGNVNASLVGANNIDGLVLQLNGTTVVNSSRNIVNVGTISNSAFTIPNSIGLAGQVLKVPSSGTTLEWGDSTSGSITGITNFADNRLLTASGSTTINGESGLLFGHTTDGQRLDISLGGQSGSATGTGYIGNNSSVVGGNSNDFVISGTNQLVLGSQGYGRIYINGSTVNIPSGLHVAGTEVISSTRNLTNIGTISSGAITSTGTVYATEFDLPSGGMLDWANGDARIVEGLVNNYSLSFQTWDGSSVSTALRLDGNNTATFAGTISSGDITITDTSTDPFLKLQTSERGYVVRIDNSDNDKFQIRDTTASATRLSIDSSGNLLVGKTNTTLGTVGIENRADGRITSTRSGNTNLVLNRLTSDGSLIDFYKNGSTVGSIGVKTDGLYIADVGVGLRFDSGGTDDIIPCNATGAAADGSINLGSSGARFNDLHLSGTITASGKITSTELTITGGTDSEDIYINNTSPTLGFTDSNSFSDSNDVYLIRGASTGKLQFQFKDDSAGTTTETFLIDQSGNTDIAGTISSGAITSSGKLEINQAGNGTSNVPSGVAEFSGQNSGSVLRALSLVNSTTATSGNGTELAFHNASNYSPTGTVRVRQIGDVATDSKMEFQIYRSGLQTALSIDHDSHVNIEQGDIKINGTTVIDSSRNFTNLNSITLTGSLGTWSVDNQGAIMNFSRNTANYIKAGSSSGYLVFQTGGSNTALTLDGSQNATFAGRITSGANGGIIGEIGGDITLVQGAIGLRINDAASALSPTTNSVNNDAAVDLGVSNIRFRNLYLSGTTNVSGRHLTAQGGATTGYGFIGDGDSGMFQQASNQLQFSTANAERLRITSAGSVLVGTTDSSPYNNNANTSADNGIALGNAGNAYIARYNFAPLDLNRTGSDGDIIAFRKSGSIVGAIGAISSDIAIYSTTASHNGLRMALGAILPTNNAGSVTNNVANLGSSLYKFKDLHLSGTINSGQNININASGTNDTRIEVGAGTSSNHYAYIDLVGDTTYSDYGLRIIRNNGGANTTSVIYHRGTGNFDIETQEAANIRFKTAGQTALTIFSSKDANFEGNVTTIGYVQHYGNLYSRNNLRVLNAAGNGWHGWAVRSNGTFNLDVGTISSGAITSSGQLTTNAGGVNVNGGTGNAYVSIGSDTGNWIWKNYRASHHLALEDSDGTGEVLRVDTSGNILFGKTSTDAGATQGFEFRADLNDLLYLARAGNAITLNRLSSDGDIALFRKDGTTVGSIGTNSGALYISSPYGNDSGLRFVSGIIAPATTTGANRDAAIDLGYSSGRFKDLYLSSRTIIGDGSNSAPAYTFGSDADTGMYRVSTNALAFATGGTERWRITSSGILQGSGTISSGAITASGDSAVGGSTNISMSAASAGQLRVFGAGYTGSIALDGNAMHVYHNSSSRDLILGTNETARLSISGSGTFTFHSNNLQSIGTISSGAITASANSSVTGTITASGGRPIVLTPSSGMITSKGSAGGWAFGYHALGTSNTDHGGFGFLGNEDSFSYYYIGAAYNDSSVFKFYKTGRLVIGTNEILDASRNLSNIGTINASGNLTTGNITVNGATSGLEGGEIFLSGAGTNEGINIDNYGGTFRVFDGSAPQVRLQLDTSGNATFAGTINAAYNGGSQPTFTVDATGDVECNTFTALGTAQIDGQLSSGESFSFTGGGQIRDAKSSSTNPILTVKNYSSTYTDGTYVDFLTNNNSLRGSIGTRQSENNTNLYIIGSSGSYQAGLKFLSFQSYRAIYPAGAEGATTDNTIDLGYSSGRFQDIYATNGTIQTSDKNEKQDIQALTEAEQRVATACKGLIRRFRWQDAVQDKDNNPDSDETARYHFGVMAQDLQSAFTAEGLDAGNYGMFISSTWTDDDGVEQTRLGVRYNELLSFIISTL